MINAAVNIDVQVFVLTYVSFSLRYIPMSTVAELYSNSMFNISENFQTVLQSGYTIFIPTSNG